MGVVPGSTHLKGVILLKGTYASLEALRKKNIKLYVYLECEKKLPQMTRDSGQFENEYSGFSEISLSLCTSSSFLQPGHIQNLI